MFTGIVQACGAVSSAVRPALELPLETLGQGLRLKIDSVQPLGADRRGNTWSWALPESRQQTWLQAAMGPVVNAAAGPAAKAATGTAADTATGAA